MTDGSTEDKYDALGDPLPNRAALRQAERADRTRRKRTAEEGRQADKRSRMKTQMRGF